jgi:8-oxo-dGTP pyrophosphatase MutT (NUDIX family)
MSSDPATTKQLSAGVVVVHCMKGEYYFLLLRAYNYWDFPKGLIEPGEAPLAAARREAKEEASLEHLEFHWGDEYFETPAYGRGKIARYYLAHSLTTNVTLPVSPELGRPEHHEYRWVDYESATHLLNERVRAALDWARARIGEHC